MKVRVLGFILLMLITTEITSCKKNHYKVNTSSIKVNIKIKRLEKDLFTLNPDEIIPMVPALKMKYGSFLRLFSLVINTGDINETSFGDLLLRFCSDKQNNDVFALTMKEFPDMKSIEVGLEGAFRHYLYYFHEGRVPAV
jgi:hypothetical protein